MNLKELKEMVDLMNENGLSEVEIEREGMKIKLKKSAPEGQMNIQPVTYTLPSVPAPSPAVKAVEAAGASVAPAVSAAPAEVNSNAKEIKSPMVGTFYRAPSPDAAPFIEVGQNVEIGQVVCIVEAMKLMNEIKSEVRGKIIESCVDNAEPVEFGQALFRVETSK